MDTVKLKHIVESLGGNVKRVNTGVYIMLPISFPWYGKQQAHSCDNSRIIAYASLLGSFQWMDVWANVGIRTDEVTGKPLGIMLRAGGTSVATLRDFDDEALTAWLEKKIGEVSNKAKEYHKMVLTLEREKCLNNLS
jgi:hypothetical protein